MVPLTTVNTSNILFICGGAFPELENVVKERLNKQSSMGFNSDLKGKYDKDKCHADRSLRRNMILCHMISGLYSESMEKERTHLNIS